jgi:hypothetical protein
MTLFDSLVKPALDAVNSIINDFHLSPEDKVKAQQAIQEASLAAARQAEDYEAKMNDIAGQNIRSETGSADKFTARARPTFLYIVNAILGFNFLGLPLLHALGAKDAAPIAIPSDVLTLFGVVMTGYVVSRSMEKISALPGDSNINVLGVVKVGNKS